MVSNILTASLNLFLGLIVLWLSFYMFTRAQGEVQKVKITE